MKQYERVAMFNELVLHIGPREHNIPSQDEARLSYQQGKEEMDEYEDAWYTHDHVGMVDACIDSIVFAMGRLYKLGITPAQYTQIFDAVMDYNMQKKKGVKEGREGFGAADAVHPENVVKPEIAIKEILDNVT